MSEKFELQSVAGRWCERSIDDMEHSALVHITNEVHAISGDMGLVALLADYVRMGREYGDMMNSDAKNMKVRIAELEKKNKSMKKALRKIVRGEAGSSEPPSEMAGCMTSMSCFQCEEFQDIAQNALKGAGK